MCVKHKNQFFLRDIHAITDDFRTKLQSDPVKRLYQLSAGCQVCGRHEGEVSFQPCKIFVNDVW